MHGIGGRKPFGSYHHSHLIMLPKVEVAVGQPLEVLNVMPVSMPLELQEGDSPLVVTGVEELLQVWDLRLVLLGLLTAVRQLASQPR